MALIPFDDRDGVIWMNGEMVDGGMQNPHPEPCSALWLTGL